MTTHDFPAPLDRVVQEGPRPSWPPEASFTTIIGAGIAGLTAAVKLAEAGRPCLLLEREDRVGGLLRSFVLDDVIFDLGPHVLFLDAPGPAEAFLADVLAGQPVIRRPFAFAIQAGGRFWKFPNHFDFFRYPNTYKAAALRAALKGRGPLPPEPISAAFELSEKCGPDLYALLFRDLFAKKTLLSPAALHHHWLARVDRTVDNEKEPYVRRSKVEAVLSAIRRLRQTYTYPAVGLEDVARLLARRFLAAGGEIRTGVRDIALDVADGRVRAITVDGQNLAVDHLVWTAPLNALNAALGADAPKLPAVTMRILMLTYARQKRLPRPYVYTYHPDPAITANRVYYPESIFRERGPADREGLCLELNVPEGTDASDEEAAIARGVADVERLGLYPAAALRQARAVTLPAAMPVYPLDYERKLALATAPVRAIQNAFAVGRQGGFYFCLTPGAVSQGLKIAHRLLGDQAS